MRNPLRVRCLLSAIVAAGAMVRAVPAAAQVMGGEAFSGAGPGVVAAPIGLRGVAQPPSVALGGLAHAGAVGTVGMAQARSVGTVGLGGLAGAAVGVLVLGTAGYHIDRATECDDDFCGLDGILIGGSIGSTILTPLGAHVANGRQGRLIPSLVASAAGTGVLWLLSAVGDEEIVLAVPLVNLITSVVVERATTPAP